MKKLISKIKEKCVKMLTGPEESGDLARLEKVIGYKFKNRKLLVEALTHPSYRYESKSIHNDNQRLEFLGDAVISMAVSTRLYGKYKDSDEGMLTSYRSMLTSGRALAVFANELKLGKWLLIGKGEEKSNGRSRTSTLADVFESVVGAVYIDGGMEPVIALLDRLMKQQVNSIDDKLEGHNPKGRLQEYCQKELKVSPLYRVIDSTGPAHSRVFEVEVSAGSISSIGRGRSKQEAERNAAMAALAALGGLA